MFLPQGGLAISVASTVWVGAIVVCVLNLRLGWSLAGLVIPGFLAPLIIMKPVVAIIDVVQGILAYMLVKFLTDYGTRLKKWDSFFGRERFFALIISSVLVRLIFDGLIFKGLAHVLQNKYNYQFNYQDNLNSYGLIIVALIANQFWKEGIARQIIPFVITTMLTCLVVRYGLMEFTNFRLSQIDALYANVDEIFASTPKVYIIILITTLIATRMSLGYGWDYGGILIAGLIALQWYSPMRIMMTMCEALVIYGICSVLLKTRFFEQRNIVHARKVLLFFNIAFLYRILLGDFVMSFLPEQRVIEYYGFGYLLSTLIALKMHENNSAIRVGAMVLYTSLVGFIAGSVIAFCLGAITGHLGNFNNSSISIENLQTIGKDTEHTSGYLSKVINKYKDEVDITAKLPLEPPSLKDIYTIDNLIINPLVKLVLNYDNNKEDLENSLKFINGYAQNYGYKITTFEDAATKQQLVILMPLENNKKTSNWGMYIFRLQAANDQIIEVPRPFDEASTLDFAAYLFSKTESQFLLIGGSASNSNKDRSGDLTRPQSKLSLYNLVSQVLLRNHSFNMPVIQLRGYSLSIDSTAKTDVDVLIAFSDGAARPSQLTDRQRKIIKIIDREKLTYSLVAADEKTSGYEVGELFLSRYLIQTPNKDLAVVWLSPFLRSAFRSPEDNYLLLSHYQALAIENISDSFENIIAKSMIQTGWQPEEKLKNLFEKYLSLRDITVLKDILNTSNYKFKHVILENDGRGYFVIFNNLDKLVGFVSLYQNAVIDADYIISAKENHPPELSSRRWIMFKDN